MRLASARRSAGPEKINVDPVPDKLHLAFADVRFIELDVALVENDRR